MRTRVTIRKGGVALGVCIAILACGCSGEQQDWHAAEAADSIESYARFMQRHPESELATQARSRIEQLEEDRDWASSGSIDTPQAYRQFLAQYPSGKWAQEARIRIETLSLRAAGGEADGSMQASASTANALKANALTANAPTAIAPS